MLTKASVDNAYATLQSKKAEFASLPPKQKAELLTACLDRFDHSVLEQFAADACEYRGIVRDTPVGKVNYDLEQIILVSMVSKYMKALREQMTCLDKTGSFKPPPSTAKMGNRTTCRVFPLNAGDSRQKPNLTCDVWLQPGKPASQGAEYRKFVKEGGNVCLVLGASNMAFLGWIDMLYMAFVDSKVCLIKWPPTHDYISKVFEHVMQPMIERGYTAHGCCDMDVAIHMSSHKTLDSIHMTGGQTTYDAIRKSFHKEFTCELGAVSPYIVCPGDEWTDEQVEAHADHLAWGIHMNQSAICFSPKLLIVSKNWAKKDLFIESTKKFLANSLAYPCWFPGMEARQKAFLKQYPNAEVRSAKSVPAFFNYDEEKRPKLDWIFINDVPNKTGEYALVTEPFAPMLSILEIDDSSVPDFLNQAADLCANKLPGNLAATVIVHSATQEKNSDAVEKILADLEYGTVSLNSNIVNSYVASGTWGGFPGNTPENPQSGIGFVHNSFMFDFPEKTVARCPFIDPTCQNSLSKPGKLPPARELVQVLLNPTGMNIAKMICATIGWPKVAAVGTLALGAVSFGIFKLARAFLG